MAYSKHKKIYLFCILKSTPSLLTYIYSFLEMECVEHHGFVLITFLFLYLYTDHILKIRVLSSATPKMRFGLGFRANEFFKFDNFLESVVLI